MMGAARRPRWVLCALALLAACAKDKTTALDLTLQITGGAIDQVRIDGVTVGDVALPLQDEPTVMFPASPRMLKTDDVLTIWFADSADMKRVVVTATGLRCGMAATAQAMTMTKTLAKGQTVEATLALDATLPVTCPGDGGAGRGGGGGRGGAGGTGGAAGAGGAAGMGGAGGSAGAAGSAGAGGVAGSTGGAAGRGGTGGSAGTGGTAGRGGTTGTAGAGGAAGRGGTTGAGGAAGRGGTTGAGGAAGRGGSGGGGTTGTGGGPSCATPPLNATAAPGALPNTTTCGYPLQGAGGVAHLLTASDYWATANAAVLNNGTVSDANCGRCVELVRTKSDNTRLPPVVVTLVGACTEPACQAMPSPRFGISGPAYAVLAPMNENPIPVGANETLTYSFVPCPVGANLTILADFKLVNNVASSVLFVQHRYGIASASVENPAVGQPVPMFRDNTGYWVSSDGNPLNFPGVPMPTFRITDVNNVTLTFSNLNPPNAGSFASIGQQFPLCPSP